MLPTLRLGRSDLTHRFSQPTNNEWHSGTVPHAVVCAILPATAIYFFSSALFSRFFSQYILALSLDSSLCCSCLFWCISPHCHSVILALRDFFTHRYQSSCITYASGFTLQPISSSLSFFSLVSFCEDMIIMFSLYLSLKVDYRPNQRPVICTK